MKLFKVGVLALVMALFTMTVTAQGANDSSTITIRIPIRVNATYTGSSTAGDTQFTFTLVDGNGNNLNSVSGITNFATTTNYVTLANGRTTQTGYVTFVMDSTEEAKALLSGDGIYLRQVIGNRSGWTYDTTEYKLVFTFYSESIDGTGVDEYVIKYVAIDDGVDYVYSSTGWQLAFNNSYRSGTTVTVTPETDEPEEEVVEEVVDEVEEVKTKEIETSDGTVVIEYTGNINKTYIIPNTSSN